MKFFLSVVGMVMIVEGLPYFISPKKMKEMITMVIAFPDNALRWFGGILMVLGLFIVYVGKSLL